MATERLLWPSRLAHGEGGSDDSTGFGVGKFTPVCTLTRGPEPDYRSGVHGSSEGANRCRRTGTNASRR